MSLGFQVQAVGGWAGEPFDVPSHISATVLFANPAAAGTSAGRRLRSGLDLKDGR